MRWYDSSVIPKHTVPRVGKRFSAAMQIVLHAGWLSADLWLDRWPSGRGRLAGSHTRPTPSPALRFAVALQSTVQPSSQEPPARLVRKGKISRPLGLRWKTWDAAGISSELLDKVSAPGSRRFGDTSRPWPGVIGTQSTGCCICQWFASASRATPAFPAPRSPTTPRPWRSRAWCPPTATCCSIGALCPALASQPLESTQQPRVQAISSQLVPLCGALSAAACLSCARHLRCLQDCSRKINRLPTTRPPSWHPAESYSPVVSTCVTTASDGKGKNTNVITATCAVSTTTCCIHATRLEVSC